MAPNFDKLEFSVVKQHSEHPCMLLPTQVLVVNDHVTQSSRIANFLQPTAQLSRSNAYAPHSHSEHLDQSPASLLDMWRVSGDRNKPGF